ncbi:MAG: hypothetical protein A3K07_00255 [Candidatus Doudnabacteria bacterium RIFCSPHIGHO2_01_43_10]|nr:MAG: hypothetical protein A3K07_00255 [Candidatus Doudnabacteria bacterium RIFCSPHIGHO2_01_43_10]OGE99275.1 MAG: hypothetical protein A3G89_01075 [Candidatus Doudnabacteria bacterium RIFCSPLOWO2_12_FULL_42_9]
MEQKIFSKFNVYDQIGYLMVGAITAAVLIFNTSYFYNIDIPPFSLDSFLLWFIIAYFFGHLIQGVANVINGIPLLSYLIREDKTDFNDNEKEILEQAKSYFGLDKQDNNKLWGLCYMLASGKDITGQVQAFNAYYSLYRGWFVVFFLESLFLFGHLTSSFNHPKLYLLLLSIFLAIIFYRRAKRFWKYTRDKVLETFVVVKTLKL